MSDLTEIWLECNSFTGSIPTGESKGRGARAEPPVCMQTTANSIDLLTTQHIQHTTTPAEFGNLTKISSQFSFNLNSLSLAIPTGESRSTNYTELSATTNHSPKPYR